MGTLKSATLEQQPEGRLFVKTFSYLSVLIEGHKCIHPSSSVYRYIILYSSHSNSICANMKSVFVTHIFVLGATGEGR